MYSYVTISQSIEHFHHSKKCLAGWCTHDTMYQWCAVELCTWNLYNFVNQCHPKFNKKEKKSLVSIFPLIPSSCPQSLATTCLKCILIVLCFPKCHINGFIQHLVFCASLLHHSAFEIHPCSCMDQEFASSYPWVYDFWSNWKTTLFTL